MSNYLRVGFCWNPLITISKRQLWTRIDIKLFVIWELDFVETCWWQFLNSSSPAAGGEVLTSSATTSRSTRAAMRRFDLIIITDTIIIIIIKQRELLREGLHHHHHHHHHHHPGPPPPRPARPPRKLPAGGVQLTRTGRRHPRVIVQSRVDSLPNYPKLTSAWRERKPLK